MGKADLLQEVNEANIQTVLDVLQGDGDWPFSFFMHQMIKMMLEFKKSSYCNFKQMLFTVGNNIENGTFIVLTSFQGSSAGVTYVHVYCSGDETPNIAQALQDPAVPWATDQIVFDVVYGSVRPSVLEVLKTKGLKYTEVTNSLYWINPGEEHKLEDRTPPSDVTVLFLNEGHAKEVNEKWPLKFLDSENVVKDCILTSFGMGVARKSDRKLLSYLVLNHAGAIFIFHTEPGEEHKGYDSLLFASVVREMNKRRRTPIAIVTNRDTATETALKEFNFVPFIPTKYYAVTRL